MSVNGFREVIERIGAQPVAGGVEYRVWAPEREKVEVLIHGSAAAGGNRAVQRIISLTRDAQGYYHGVDRDGRVGDLYRYRLDADEARTFPDPASRFQPEGVHGPSEVTRGGAAYGWMHDANWRRFSLRGMVVYELHVGTFTPAGTFRAVIEKLDYLRDLGVNAIELMPLADFPGRWNWGYDGVCLYAPSRAYGNPDDLRALIDAAHARQMGVILDAVYNHLGPDGNYLSCYSKSYFNEARHTPWGAALNFDGEECAAVRNFFVNNAVYWLEEFHFDGFRLDAIHAILDESPRHVLSEIAAAVHERGGFVMAEDERNLARLAFAESEGGAGLDGLWADDFHHTVRVALTGEREAYLRDFTGTPGELRDTLQHGWHYRGQKSPTKGKPRGSECNRLPPNAFIYCISNHDQVGNRAFGERLTASTTAAAYRAASALLCLSPYTPLLFMGQEWAASTPFLYFTDHNAELGRLVTEGRRREFKGFAAFAQEDSVSRIPDPQAESTFMSSKLLWSELKSGAPARTLALYRAALALRRTEPALQNREREHWNVLTLADDVSAIRFEGDADSGACLIVFDLKGGEAPSHACGLPAGVKPGEWRLLFSSNDAAFGGGGSAFSPKCSNLQFIQPEVVVLKRIAEH